MTTYTDVARRADVRDAIVASACSGSRCPAQHIVVAALAAGPATTKEVRSAAGAVLRDLGEFYRWSGDLYAALRALEQAGRVRALRTGGRSPVLWALPITEVPA